MKKLSFTIDVYKLWWVDKKLKTNTNMVYYYHWKQKIETPALKDFFGIKR